MFSITPPASFMISTAVLASRHGMSVLRSLLRGSARYPFIGTDDQCSPRHRMPFNSRNEGSNAIVLVTS